jgi:hypothetical protein
MRGRTTAELLTGHASDEANASSVGTWLTSGWLLESIAGAPEGADPSAGIGGEGAGIGCSTAAIFSWRSRRDGLGRWLGRRRLGPARAHAR